MYVTKNFNKDMGNHMRNKIQTLQQSQLLSETAREAKLTIDIIKKALEAYEKVSKAELLNGKKVPLPGGMGYIHLSLTTSKSRIAHLNLTNSDVTISPKLRTTASFSDPWKDFIQNDERAECLIEKLIRDKLT